MKLDTVATALEAAGIRLAGPRLAPIAGGDINAAFRLDDATGRRFFVKRHEPGNLAMFEAERDGLDELAAAGAVRVPRPVACGSDDAAAFLVLEWLDVAPLQPTSAARLGAQLAQLHRVTSPTFGWKRDNTIGATPQRNTPSADWIGFWQLERLEPQLRLAAGNGFRGRLQRLGENLLADCGAFFAGYQPAPSLLHGDLWGGNAAALATGEPVIYDPAVYFGDREADIAMSELFGGFPRDFLAAYRDAWPLDAGYPVRRELYNLYHVLNHANLFGGSYGAQAERMLERLLVELSG